ncbi:MAG: M56 family metallopeptidase [Lachnospiraceae bacterium]|nr:M56 family metallopeptidase [uncultured Acetatifactor sp.]MCI9218765.1 M56 family metallopeptidase [Lachnospiraceae bacterium]
MLHFRMNMPFFLMAFYGSIMIVVVLLLRALLKNKLPKFVFPVLWGVVLVRLLVPFSLSSPLSLPVPAWLSGLSGFSLAQFEEAALSEDVAQLQPGGAAQWEGGGSPGTTAPEAAGMVQRPSVRENPDGASAESVSQTVAEEVVYGAASESSSYNVINESPLFSQKTMRKALPAFYLLGLAVAAGILAWQKITYTKKLRGGLLMEHNETVNELLRDMGMGHVLVFSSDEIASPLVCGLLSPRIYLPTRMDFGNAVLLRHVLAHEAMHIRRRDNLVKAVMLAAILLNWYNPLVWLMAKCLASDLEAACDAAVLSRCGEDERKGYAYSLLAMAVSASRGSLLYSAFSKTEVERRVKGILAFRKASAFALLTSALLLAGGTVAFATGGQAPFSHDLTSYCASSNSRWGVRVEIARDIALGEHPQKRAEEVVFSVLDVDATQDPDIIREEIQAALAREFGVERSAFDVAVSLCLDSETVDAQYADWGITRLDNGFLRYQGEQVRTYRDEMLGSYQSREEGPVDIVVERNRLGEITAVSAVHEGDAEYDRRTRELGQYVFYYY